eukprot:2011933-Rhodomonas_salina.2
MSCPVLEYSRTCLLYLSTEDAISLHFCDTSVVVPAYALAMPCTVLQYSIMIAPTSLLCQARLSSSGSAPSWPNSRSCPLSAYACPERGPVLTSRMLLLDKRRTKPVKGGIPSMLLR